MRDLRKEVFKVVHLNSQNQIMETVDLFEGTVNSSAVSSREVMGSAIKNNAASLILATKSSCPALSFGAIIKSRLGVAE